MGAVFTVHNRIELIIKSLVGRQVRVAHAELEIVEGLIDLENGRSRRFRR